MEVFLQFLWAFLVGGIFCAIGQILIDKTNLTPAKILVIFVVAGVVLEAIGVYQYLIDFAGAGASVPLTGFGHILAKGVREAVEQRGLFGIFTGALTASSGGITAAVIFGLIVALTFRSGSKINVEK